MHAAPDGLLTAHSIAEAFLYVRLTFCPRCRHRPIHAAGDLKYANAAAGEWTLPINCEACRFDGALTFRLEPPPSARHMARINPSVEPSQLIDVAGWLSLFRVILDGASRETNKEDARAMTLEAAECLDEALRFYPVGQDLPPATAFFNEQSSERFAQHPEQFRRSKLADIRSRLPSPGRESSRSPQGRTPRARQWWKFWQRS